MDEKIVATNKTARRDYMIFETLEAGIELKGREVKSLRASKADLKDSFARVENGEMYLYNMHISPYEYATIGDQDPKRIRKLLLHRAQIRKLLGQTSQKGLTIIPLRAYFKRGLVKVELALAKGKKVYDKREEFKRKEAEREVARAMRRK